MNVPNHHLLQLKIININKNQTILHHQNIKLNYQKYNSTASKIL
jgi:hypothetical protein